jgi:hypothetical protein
MAHTFHGLAQTPAAVADIHAAFGRADYWLARLATSAAVTTLNSLTVGADGTVSVRFAQDLGRQLLPGVVARLVPGDVRMDYTETWTPVDDGRAQGRIGVAVSGGLGSCSATAWLEPSPAGSQMRFTGSVKVRIPLVGGNLEKAVGADLAANIPSVLDFTTTWIADRP